MAESPTLEPAQDSPSGPLDRTMFTYRRAAPLMVHGCGAWMQDDAGKTYLDLISGIGANSLGHAHPALTAALADQAGKLGHVSNLFRHAPGEELSRRLCERTGMGAVFFSNSGSEAGEAALKIARKFQRARGQSERQRFVALEGGFHGRTFGSLSVTSKAAYRQPFGRGLDSVFVHPGDIDGLRSALSEAPCALVLEPIQGEGGVNPLSAEFLQAARELCNGTGTVLIHDEVQCGGGRTGTFLASEGLGADPDIVTLAKPLGAGLPIGATLAKGAFAEALLPGDHGSTFGGGALVARAALTVLDELDGGLQVRIQEAGTRLADGLDTLVAESSLLTERRGRGLMQGIVAPGKAAEIVDALFHAGVLTCTAAGDVVRFLPPFILTDDDIDEGLTRLDGVLQSLQAAAS